MTDNARIPTEKVLEALLQSPSEHLSVEEMSSLRKALVAVREEL